ncbi:MAG: DHH family phosphoesterase [Planctomycetota bacterium]
MTTTPSRADQPTDAWSSNTTPANIAEWLSTGQSIAILTHARPDGDAIGSTTAVARALNQATKTKRARIYYTGGMPRWADDIIQDTPHTHVDASTPPADFNPDRILVVDTGSWSQLDALGELVKERAADTAIVDHHLSGNAEIADRRLLATSAAAACEPISEICQHILSADTPSKLPTSVATPLYLGLATDTGWFKFSNVKPSTLRLAACLIEAGVDHAALHVLIELNESPARLRIVAKALASLDLIDRDRIAIMTITTEDAHAAHAGPSDTGGLSNYPLSIGTVRVAATITQVETVDPEPAAKISLRSKPGPNMIDVNEVAKKLGGGGHANAAGAKLACSVEEAKARLIKALTQ